MIKDTNITINVLDLEQSISFYQSLGFELKYKWNAHYAQLSAPGIKIGLHPANAQNLKGNSGNLSIGFTTDNFNGIKRSLIDLGINVSEREEEGGSFIHFKDPDGTSLYFIKPNW